MLRLDMPSNPDTAGYHDQNYQENDKKMDKDNYGDDNDVGDDENGHAMRRKVSDHSHKEEEVASVSAESDKNGPMIGGGGDGEEEEEKAMRGAERPRTPLFVYTTTLMATMSSLLLGYSFGVMSGAMLYIEPHFDLTVTWHEMIVSILIASAAVAAIVAGWIADRSGRRFALWMTCAVYTLGGVVMAVAPTKEILLTGRIIAGLGVGLSSVVIPVYIAEISPVHIRGKLLCLHQIVINIGIVVSSLFTGAFSYADDGWRYMLGMSVIPGALQIVAVFFMPESPRWLIARGRFDQAKDVLVRIRGRSEVTQEFDDILKTVDEDKSHQSAKGIYLFLKVVRTPHVRKATLIGIALLLFQGWCGINIVFYYSGTLLKMAGFPVKDAIWLVVVPNTIHLLSSCMGVYFVERIGRRLLLLVSMAGCIVGLVILAVGFQMVAESSPDINPNVVETGLNGSIITECVQVYRTCDSCVKDNSCGYCYSDSHDGSCLPSDDEEFSDVGRCNKTSVGTGDPEITWAFEYCPSDYTWIALAGMGVFVFAFAPGMGPMPWAINAEMYPLWARGTCNSIAAFSAWVFNLILSFVFLTMSEAITIHGTFWFYCAITVVGVVVLYVFLPETKDKTLEEVEQVFMTSQKRESLATNRKRDGDSFTPITE